MNRRKITAMLCIMAMLMTTLSNIFVVTAAAEPTLKISIADTANENGNYLATVSYEGFEEGVKVGTIDVLVNIPKDNVTNLKSLNSGLINYKDAAQGVAYSFMAASEDTYLKGTKADLFTFEVTNVTAAGRVEISDISSAITDYSTDPLDGVIYNKDNNLKFIGADLPYEEQQGDRSAVNMTYKTNDDGSKTVTVSYDMTNANIDGIKVGTIDILIKVAKDNVTNLKSLNSGLVNYKDAAEGIAYSFMAASEDTYLKNNVENLFTFDVKAGVALSLKASDAAITDYSTDPLDGVIYNMADNKIFAATLKIPEGSEPDATTEPTTDPDATTKPDATDKPSATAAPKPIKIEKPTEVTIGGLKDAKAYSIKLSDIAAETGAEMPEKVNIVIQGFDKKNVAIGYVVIPNITDLSKEYMGYVSNAAKTRINVFDAETGDPVAQVYEIK